MTLRIHVEAKVTDGIEGLSWATIFAGTFPHRGFQRIHPELTTDTEVVIEHRCSEGMEAIFFFKTLGWQSPDFAVFLEEVMPILLNVYYEDEDEDEDDDEDDDEDEGEDDDGDGDGDGDSDSDSDSDSDGEGEDEGEGDGEGEGGKSLSDQDVYASDFITVLKAALEYAERRPGTVVLGGTLGALREEMSALLMLMQITDESVYDVRWTNS